MGCYVNPASMSKERWLEANAEATLEPKPITETHVPVCLVDNGMFTAAGVAFSLKELENFCQPHDTRDKRWFYVERAKVRAVSDLAIYER